MLLLLTTCLARVDARLQGLDGVQRLLDTLLDGSARYSLPQAAATGSVRLLDRVVCHVNNGDNDPCLDKTWFAKAMKHAILNNDLAMVHRIHYHHPEPLAHYSLNVALENGGSRDLVQWLMEHRHDQMCTSEPPARMMSTRPLDCCIRDSLAMAFGDVLLTFAGGWSIKDSSLKLGRSLTKL
ncbi:hypothetical protein Poli38472_003779 [Pythium oligandrum]|uniref:Uncharacterized protein n=1 Tax=Pythium oligandrum TaxID=41045 RepID=A0A8K1FM81_PYTOL|nr:hypothetical protein Poli38472_003779 [Pythium oligandrum]|eukprot:TMW66014.1 hypothetical protein Poli38472_003779 [Pythium oligandrum]